MNKSFKIAYCFFLAGAVVLVSLTSVQADTLLLKNGHSVDGVVVRESEDSVTIDIGGGSVTFKRDEIQEVLRATPEEKARLHADWEKQKKEAEKQDELARARREKELDEWRRKSAEEEALRKATELEKRLIGANTQAVDMKSGEGGYVRVEALINGSASASLVVDTGSPVILLTSSYIKKLDLSAKELRKKRKVFVLNGENEVVDVILKSVRIGEVEEKDVQAFVLLESNAEVEKSSTDGLLGLSFLNRFHVTFDKDKNRILLRK